MFRAGLTLEEVGRNTLAMGLAWVVIIGLGLAGLWRISPWLAGGTLVLLILAGGILVSVAGGLGHQVDSIQEHGLD